MVCHVFGSQHISACRPGMPLFQERLLLGPPKKRPTPSAAATAFQPSRPVAIVFANPFPDAGLRHLQEIGNLLRVEACMMGHPDGQTSLVTSTIGCFMQPIAQFFITQVRLN